MNKRVATVIFDCDGVLVDSERLTVEVEAEILTQMGWPLTSADVVERFMGRSDADMLALVAAELGAAAAAEFDRVSTERVVAAFHDRLTSVDGIEDLVDALADAGIATCVASSGSHRKMALTLGLTGLHDRFAGRIYSASEVANGKPAPDLFLHAAASMQTAPESCVVVEDSVPGVQASRAAAIPCYGFAGGLTPRDQLIDAGAIAFDTMAELTTRLVR